MRLTFFEKSRLHSLVWVGLFQSPEVPNGTKRKPSRKEGRILSAQLALNWGV